MPPAKLIALTKCIYTLQGYSVKSNGLSKQENELSLNYLSIWRSVLWALGYTLVIILRSCSLL